MKRKSLNLLALIGASTLLLAACNLFPKPESLIQVPKKAMAVSVKGRDFVSVALKNLPKGTELSVPKGPVGAEPVIAGDLDGDGKQEVLVLYRSINNRNQVGAFVLKKQKKAWEKVFAKRGLGYDISWANAIDITGDGHDELLLGWQSGVSSGNLLEIYTWKKGKLKVIAKMPYHQLEVIQFAGNAKTSIAVWNRDLADVYKIDLLTWAGKAFVSDTAHYPSYFQKVIDYYKQRTTEVPDAAYYWYYLADAYLKANHSELALSAVNKGMNLKTVVPSQDHFEELKRLISIRNEALQSHPVRIELKDPDISFEVPRELAPYISTNGEQGPDNSYMITVELAQAKKRKSSLFTIEVLAKDLFDTQSVKGLEKIGEAGEYLYYIKRTPLSRDLLDYPLLNGYTGREQMIASIHLGEMTPKFQSLEDQMVINMMDTANRKYWYVISGGKMPEGEIKTISINDREFRHLGKDLDTTVKLSNYLADVFTDEAIQSFKNRADIFEYYGKLVQPNADGGSLVNYSGAEVIQKKDNGDEKEFDVKVPLGHSYNYEVIHVGFQLTDQGWRIFSEPGTF
jgi:hypothetical protein